MNDFVYANGKELYLKANLVGKIGRIAFECDMSEKLLQLGYERFNGFNLRTHLVEANNKYKELVKQLALLKSHK